MIDFVNNIEKEELTYGSLFEPARVIELDGDRHLFVEVNNRIGTYSKVLVAGKTYFPKKNDLGLLMYVGKFKYPVFLPAFFDGIFKEGTDVKITYKTDKYGGDGSYYTQDEIAWFAQQAGFTGEDLDIISAIAMVESFPPGNPKAHNPKPPDNSYGLWQINMIDGYKGQYLGVERRKKYNLTNNEELFDPLTNAKVAYDIYSSRGKKFGDWSTYTNGAYKAFKRKVIPTKPNH